MLIHKKLPSLFYAQFTSALVKLSILSLVVLPFIGCSEGGNGTEPLISSLSTPTDPQQSEDAQSEPNPNEIAPNEQEDTAMSSIAPEETAPLPDEAVEADLEPPPPTGATAQLNWAASSDPNVQGYFVHFGKQSSGAPGSCSYEQSQRVGPPPATITGLDPNTPYFFAISAFGESESEEETPCSNEIVVVTPAVQS